MTRYKPTVLIVDDDYYTVECLRTLIDWESVGMVPVAHAYDGMTALQLLGEWQPDILLTDISMPVLSGLDLAARARQQREGLYIILLTAHEDFQYARRGLELGADAYLLKQLDYATLTTDLKQHVGKALEKRDGRRRQAALQAAEDTLVDQLLSAWLRENDPVKLERLTRLDAFQPIMQAETVSVLLCDFSGFPAQSRDFTAANQTADAASRAATEWLLRQDPPYPAFHPFGQTVGLLAPSNLCTSLRKQLFRHLAGICPEPPMIAVGTPVITVQAPRSLQQADLCISATLLGFPESQPGETTPSDPQRRIHLAALTRFARQLAECIRDAMDAVAMMNMTEYLRLARQLGADEWHAALYLLRTCLTVLPAEHAFSRILSEDLHLWDQKSRQELCAANALADRLQMSVTRWLQPEGTLSGKAPGLHVKRLMVWVRQHLEDDPSLVRAADAFLVSPNHLGKMFHKETGEYFSDYVLHMKLERSCEYLGQPSLRIYEIAERLGFRNLSHFHAKFHERYGCSPGNWRKQRS